MILQRGDTIHLAVPDAGSDQRNKELNDQLYAWYASFGIILGVTTHHSNLNTVTIVSVIRNQ